MNNFAGEIVYNKFINEKIEIKVNVAITERILMGCDIFIKYLEEEMPNTTNPALRDDIERITRVVEGLRQLGDTCKEEGSIEMTISEFLIFKHGLERVAGLIGALDLSDTLSIKYMDFIIYMDEIYGTLNEDVINLYYSFLATYDAPQERILN